MAKRIVLSISPPEATHLYLALVLYNEAILLAKLDNDAGDTIAEQTQNLKIDLNGSISRYNGTSSYELSKYVHANAKEILQNIVKPSLKDKI